MSRPAHLGVLLELHRSRVPHVLVGAMAVMHYATERGEALMTDDADILLKPDSRVLGSAIGILERHGYALHSGGEPLGRPDALTLRRMVELRATVRAAHDRQLGIDLMLEARPYPFSRWWSKRRLFRVEGGSVVCADLEMVLEAKRQAGRPKDTAFLLSFYARNPRPRRASSRGAGPRPPASRRRRPTP